MTYCVGLLVDTGLVLLSDSRTNAGVDQINTFRKMATFQRPNERVLVLMSAGNLAITQAVVNILHENLENAEHPAKIFRAKNMFDAARVVGDALREVDQRDAAVFKGAWPRVQRHVHLGGSDSRRGAAALSHLLGGQLHRVLARDAVLSDRRVEVRQAHHRPRDLALEQSRSGRQVRARLHGLDHPLESHRRRALGSRHRTARRISSSRPISASISTTSTSR